MKQYNIMPLCPYNAYRYLGRNTINILGMEIPHGSLVFIDNLRIIFLRQGILGQ